MSARRVHWLPLAGAVFIAQACSRDLEVLPDESCRDHDGDAVVAFQDPALERATRAALNFDAQQALTCELVALVSTLDASGPAVADLAGIQNLTELSFLVLANTSVTSLAPLRDLASLRSVTLDGSTALGDIGPLLDNPEIGARDLVYLRGTRVRCADVAALSAKGATVFSDCVGWWPGDGDPDDAFGRNAGTITGDVTFAPGRVGQAFRFDGQGGRVATRADVGVHANSPRTVAAWVMSAVPDASGCCPTPFGWGAPAASGGFGSAVRDGTWWFWGYQDDIDTRVAVDQEWNHHVVTYGASVVRYYLNGRQVAEGRRALNTTVSPLVIGGGFDRAPSRHFTGLVDELLIFNRALSPDDIEALYRSY
jgi:hypothetical protein